MCRVVNIAVLVLLPLVSSIGDTFHMQYTTIDMTVGDTFPLTFWQ